MDIINENVSRKIDAQGRIVIPKGIRNRMNMQIDDEVNFFTFTMDGDSYIAFCKENEIEPRYMTAADVLIELGEEIPISLEKKILGED